MKKRSLLYWFVAFVCAALIFTGCPQEADDDDPVLSDKAGLDTGSAVVKDVSVDFTGSTGDGSAIGAATTGTVTIAKAALGTGKTTFNAADSGTTKTVRVAAVAVDGYTETAFNDANAYADETVAAGDVFFVKVTSQDGKAFKWYKVTVLVNVGPAYSLKASETSNAADTSGLTIASATDDGTQVTITLGGTVTKEFTSTTRDASTSVDGTKWDPNCWWSGSDFDSAPGTYAAAYINGLFPTGTANTNPVGAQGKVLGIKQTNQALRFYIGHSNLLAAKPTTPAAADTSNNATVWIDTSNTAEVPVRWRLYGTTNDQGIITDGDTFGLLIWNGALTPKTAKLEIADYASYTAGLEPLANTTRTFVVDYSGVVFEEAVADVTDDYGLSASDNANPAGLTYVSAEKKADGIVYVKLGGTVTGGITQWAESNIWGAQPGEDAPEGNWSWAVITGILPAGLQPNSGIEIKQTNASLLYYQGVVLNDVSSDTSLPEEAPTIVQDDSPASIFFVGGTAYKWAKYGTGRNPKDTDDDGFGVLLWSGASPKTATLEITPKSGTKYTVIVDWSGLTINAPAEEEPQT